MATSLLFSAHQSPPAGSGMGASVTALVQSPGSAAEATAAGPEPVASRRRDVSPGACCCSATGEAFPVEGSAEHPPHLPQKQQLHPSPLPLQAILGGLGPPGPSSGGTDLRQLLACCTPSTPPPPLFQKHRSAILFPQPLPKAWRRSCPRVRQSCLSYLRTQGFSCCIPASRGWLMQAGLRLPRHPPPRLLPGAGVRGGGGTHKNCSWLCDGDR